MILKCFFHCNKQCTSVAYFACVVYRFYNYNWADQLDSEVDYHDGEIGIFAETRKASLHFLLKVIRNIYIYIQVKIPNESMQNELLSNDNLGLEHRS